VPGTHHLPRGSSGAAEGASPSSPANPGALTKIVRRIAVLIAPSLPLTSVFLLSIEYAGPLPTRLQPVLSVPRSGVAGPGSGVLLPPSTGPVRNVPIARYPPGREDAGDWRRRWRWWRHWLAAARMPTPSRSRPRLW
jgi:hypothetical protein